MVCKYKKKYKKYQLTILITWQKLAPLFLILFQKKILLLLFTITSIVIGRLLQLNKTNLIEIMRYSSVFNLGWIFLAIMTRIKILLWFNIIYWTSVAIIIYILKISKINTLNTEIKSNIKKWTIIIIIANLAGMPPLIGFLIKWLLIIAIIKTSLLLITTIALIIRATNFFIYLRIIRKQILSTTNKNQIEIKTIRKTIKFLILVSNTTPIILLTILGYAWMKGL